MSEELRHNVGVHATAFGWGWGCSCGRQGAGVSARSPEAAREYGFRHVRAAHKVASDVEVDAEH